MSATQRGSVTTEAPKPKCRPPFPRALSSLPPSTAFRSLRHEPVPGLEARCPEPPNQLASPWPRRQASRVPRAPRRVSHSISTQHGAPIIPAQGNPPGGLVCVAPLGRKTTTLLACGLSSAWITGKLLVLRAALLLEITLIPKRLPDKVHRALLVTPGSQGPRAALPMRGAQVG